MRQIKLKNVTQEELLTLQQETYEYQNLLEQTFRKSSDFFDAIITLDIAFRLWFLFRTRIENQTPKNGYTISLKASEAAVLLKVCLYKNNTGEFEKNVKVKYSHYLDQQLKSL